MIGDGKRTRQRRYLLAGSASVAVTVLAVAGIAFAFTGQFDHASQPATHVTTASPTTGGNQTPPCRGTDLQVSPGGTGTTSDQRLTYTVNLTNISADPCTIRGTDLSAEAITNAGAAAIDLSAIDGRAVTAAPDTAAGLVFAMGKPAGAQSPRCSPVTPAELLSISLGGSAGTTVTVPGMGAGCAEAVVVGLVTVESATSPLSPLSSPGGVPAIADTVLNQQDQETAEAFLQYAGSRTGGAFATSVEVALGGSVVTTLSRSQAADPASWTVDTGGYAERDGTISALELVVGTASVNLGYDTKLGCNGPGWAVQTSIGQTGHRIGIEPAGIDVSADGCFGWWRVTLYSNNVGQVSAVNIELDVP